MFYAIHAFSKFANFAMFATSRKFQFKSLAADGATIGYKSFQFSTDKFLNVQTIFIRTILFFSEFNINNQDPSVFLVIISSKLTKTR